MQTAKCISCPLLVETKGRRKDQSVCNSASFHVSIFPDGFLCCTFLLHSWHFTGVFQLLVLNAAVCPAIYAASLDPKYPLSVQAAKQSCLPALKSKFFPPAITAGLIHVYVLTCSKKKKQHVFDTWNVPPSELLFVSSLVCVFKGLAAHKQLVISLLTRQNKKTKLLQWFWLFFFKWFFYFLNVSHEMS